MSSWWRIKKNVRFWFPLSPVCPFSFWKMRNSTSDYIFTLQTHYGLLSLQRRSFFQYTQFFSIDFLSFLSGIKNSHSDCVCIFFPPKYSVWREGYCQRHHHVLLLVLLLRSRTENRQNRFQTIEHPRPELFSIFTKVWGSRWGRRQVWWTSSERTCVLRKTVIGHRVHEKKWDVCSFIWKWEDMEGVCGWDTPEV